MENKLKFIFLIGLVLIFLGCTQVENGNLDSANSNHVSLDELFEQHNYPIYFNSDTTTAKTFQQVNAQELQTMQETFLNDLLVGLTGDSQAFGQGTKPVSVFEINGEKYPKGQFKLALPFQECSSAFWTSDWPAVNLAGTQTKENPDSEGCGFGKKEELAESKLNLNEDQATVFLKAFFKERESRPLIYPQLVKSSQETENETSGGIANNTSTENQIEGNENTTTSEVSIDLAVLEIGRLFYPKSQFHVSDFPEDACGAAHWHSNGPVYPVRSEWGPIVDPNPRACGFGKVGEIPELTIKVTESEMNEFNHRSSGENNQGNTVGTTTERESIGTIPRTKDENDDNPSDVPPPTMYGEELDDISVCGPNITDLVLEELKTLSERAKGLSGSEKGAWDGARFLNRNGTNIDLLFKKIKENDTDVCPTKNCIFGSSLQLTSYEFCNRCILGHIANDLAYGLTGNRLNVPYPEQLLGAQYAEISSYGGLDPLSSQAAYKMGNSLAEALDENPDITPEEMCQLFEETNVMGLTPLIGPPFVAPTSNQNGFEAMENERPDLDNCQLTCEEPATLIKSFASGIDWSLSGGSNNPAPKPVNESEEE